jgi:nucleoside-diphosphate-sugar epimerase
MRVLVAGGTGAIGRQLVPLLCEVGAAVAVMTRPTSVVAYPGVQVVVADALDGESVRSAVRDAAPDVIVNLLTAIPHALDPRRVRRDMALTNRLRVEGTAHLVRAAHGARVVSEGLAYAYEPDGGPVADETRPLWARAPRPYRPTVAALLELERLTIRAGGTVLRLGHLYGPGTTFAPGGDFLERVRASRAPQVGTGAAVFSFVHTHDVATSITAALDKDVTGPFNIVDDTPAYVREWLPELARIIGAPAPRRVPAPLARLVAGSWGVAYMNRIVGADNSRARLSLDWRPRFTTWREGFATELTSPPGRRESR